MTASERSALDTGLATLEQLYLESIRAFAPPNPQFERDRIIDALPNRREIAYVLGFLSEGENEAALLLALIRDMLAAEPQAEVAHILDEAWYYLRTSIDAAWQLDRGKPSIVAALKYLAVILERRLKRVRSGPPQAPLADYVAEDARTLLEQLRAGANHFDSVRSG